MNVQSVLATRFLLAGAVLAVIVLARRPAWPGWSTVGLLVLMGAVGYSAQSAAYFNSIRYVPIAITSILLYTYPVIVTVLSRPIYRVPLTRARLTALGVALGGTFLVASPSGGLQVEGVVLGLLSALFYSAYILGGKRLIERVDPWLATAVISVSAGLAYLTYGLAGNTLSPPPNTSAWLAILGLSVVSTVIGAGAFLAGLRLTDPGRASLISTLEPVSAVLLAALFFGELLGPAQLAGGVLVVAAVTLIARSQPRDDRRGEPIPDLTGQASAGGQPPR
jgi:drug/metabolite transporter (DMT)-like permease